MGDFSFEIKTTNDLFNILLEDYKEYLENRISSRHALHCAIISWHIYEWANKEFEPELSGDKYKEMILNRCPSLEIMRTLANGTKHNKHSIAKWNIKNTELHLGAFCKQFSREFDTSHLKLELNDGRKIYFEDEIKKVIIFWSEYLKSKTR